MKRHVARENTFKLVFERILTEEENQLSFDRAVLATEESEREYLSNLYRYILGNLDALKEHIEKHSFDFAFDRIFRVDLAIMYVAIGDMLHANVPYQVAINEAVELAKKYSTEKSPSYINGVLKGFVNEQFPK